MIIVISSADKSISAETDLRFGRCKYFAVYDTETKECTFKGNDAINSSQGAGIAAAQAVTSFKANVVLTGNLGPKALSVLEASGIKGYKFDQTTVEKAIDLFEKNELSQITEPGKPQKK